MVIFLLLVQAGLQFYRVGSALDARACSSCIIRGYLSFVDYGIFRSFFCLGFALLCCSSKVVCLLVVQCSHLVLGINLTTITPTAREAILLRRMPHSTFSRHINTYHNKWSGSYCRMRQDYKAKSDRDRGNVYVGAQKQTRMASLDVLLKKKKTSKYTLKNSVGDAQKV